MAQLLDLLDHPHPLVFNKDEQERSKQSYVIFCTGCKKEVSGPSFSCAECGFYVHKECAEAPLQITNHPFDVKHPLILQQFSERIWCRICYAYGEGFLYHCSYCKTYLHINCGNLPRDSDGKFRRFSYDVHEHPLVVVRNEILFCCNECKSSSNPMEAFYVCFDCKFYLHEKCLHGMPLEISHPYHREHHLFLVFVEEETHCSLCDDTRSKGWFYRCSLCRLAVHRRCDGLPPTIEDKSHHEHPFTLLLRPDSFNCDACGDEGKLASYICSSCNLQVHKKCISLPCFIRINLHHHALTHKFFLPYHQHESRLSAWDCRICYNKVNLKHGCFYCSKTGCSFITHVNCAIAYGRDFGLIELQSEDEGAESYEFSNESVDPIIRVIREIKVGDDIIAAEIVHFSHQQHSLILADEMINGNKVVCDGCMLPILSSFYHCSHCDFFLHKGCAELRRKTRLWCHKGVATLLSFTGKFECSSCRYTCSGFFYDTCDLYHESICLRCATLPYFRRAALPYSRKYQARKDEHEHFLLLDVNAGVYDEFSCSACGEIQFDLKYQCKDCGFALDQRCMTLPQVVWHKCDKHSLKLTYGDSNGYTLHHYCDICEQGRDPELWFYHCEICNTCLHPKCALGDYPFVKRGITFKFEHHLHPLTSVQKIYYYPKCMEKKCLKPCQDLALECLEPGCNYIAHWGCIRSSLIQDRDLRTDS